ncbi:MAG: 50S ribosomal protein L31 [bacterium]|nr:50S ribosomal protein L31 [bacterium]
MKQDTHPQYFTDAKAICACGTIYETGSTRQELHIELCKSCHPFYTGKQNLVDTEGRVEKFAARAAKASVTAETRKGKKVKATTRVRKEKA